MIIWWPESKNNCPWVSGHCILEALPPICPFIHLSIFQSNHPSIHPSIHPFTHLPYPSIHSPTFHIHPSIHSSPTHSLIYPSILYPLSMWHHSFIYLSNHPNTHPPIHSVMQFCLYQFIHPFTYSVMTTPSHHPSIFVCIYPPFISHLTHLPNHSSFCLSITHPLIHSPIKSSAHFISHLTHLPNHSHPSIQVIYIFVLRLYLNH